jgi:hypothetical protein
MPVTLLFGARKTSLPGELRDLSAGGCFFESQIEVDIDRRVLVVLRDSADHTCRAAGRVVRTDAYQGFAVLFDGAASVAVEAFIGGFGGDTHEERVARLAAELKPEIQIL